MRKIRSYGRTKGCRLNAKKTNILKEFLPNKLISKDNINQIFSQNSSKPVWFEIGFGDGTNLVWQAVNNNVTMIGCEPYKNSLAQALIKIKENQLSNIYVHDNDAIDLLKTLPDKSIDKLFILFPDPWHKKKHHKRRIISKDNIDLFSQKLKQDAIIRIATDHLDYAFWTIRHFIYRDDFIWLARSKGDWLKEPSDWIKTKYQQKQSKNSDFDIFFEFQKL